MIKKLTITNQRMLKLNSWLQSKGHVSSDREFFRLVGCSESNIYYIKNGKQGFTIAHIVSAIKRWQNINDKLANPYYLFNIPKPKSEISNT